MKLSLSLALALCAWTVTAQNITTVTTVVMPGTVTNALGGRDWNTGTNVVAIANGEAARVATLIAGDGLCWFEKRGEAFAARKGDVVSGPAAFYLRTASGETALLTLERWRVKKEALPKP